MELPAIKQTKTEKQKRLKSMTSTDKDVMQTWLDQHRVQFAQDMIDYRVVNKHKTNLSANAKWD